MTAGELMKEQQIDLTEKEKNMVQAVADMRGISFDDALSVLASEGMERRFRRNTGKGPANNIRKFRGRK